MFDVLQYLTIRFDTVLRLAIYLMQSGIEVINISPFSPQLSMEFMQLLAF